MDYPSLLSRIYALGARGVDLGLDRVRFALEALDFPDREFDSVQIGGTNGKGSTSALLESAVRSAGVRTGLFTSPHLHRYAERFRVDGDEARDDVIARHLSRVLALLDRPNAPRLTFFEATTCAACSLFAEQGVELAILEVGLGGRLDATTIATPKATAITSIGFDHTALLGSTMAEIAREKAGIAKPRTPLFVGPVPDVAFAQIDDVASAVGAPVFRYGRDFHERDDFTVPWPGAHQRENAAVARAVFDFLAQSDSRLSIRSFVDGARRAVWPGRFEIVEIPSRHILDGAHNTESVTALVSTLGASGERPDAILFGACRDKPVDQMLEILCRLGAPLVLAPPPLDRAFDPRHHRKSFDTPVAPTIAVGLERCREIAGPSGTVLVTGSLFSVAEARRLLLGEKCDPPIGM